ncbi:cytochrome c-type biogenesis protein [Thioalkalivibrio sp.]|uniref:cytochrome c-type biogenesis protein n=1 Tax=Thioalkalivibrio sp. TaxID=2093813 RepID=UPI00356987D1
MSPWHRLHMPLSAIAVALLLLLPVAAAAQTAPPSEPMSFDSELQEQRYQKLIRELRCTVCQNQNLIESNAPLANDLRRQIALMINDGADTDEVIDYMVARYGDFVLFRPPMKGITYLLWFGPVAMLLIGLAALGTILWRRRTQVGSDPLSTDEAERLRRILGDGGHDKK